VQGLEGYTCIPIRMEGFSELPERDYRPWVARAKLPLDIPFIMKDTKGGYNYQSAASPDGTLFTTTYGDTRYHPHAHPVFVWDLEGGKFRVINRLIGHDKPVLSMAFSTDQTKLVTADLGGEVRLWYLNTNAWVQVISQADSEFTAVTLSPDGRYILAGDSQGRLFLWTDDGQLVMTNHTHREMVNTLAFSKDGRFAASGGFDNMVQVWEFDWAYQFPSAEEWDAGVDRYLSIFLTLHKPYHPDETGRYGQAQWTEREFQGLLEDLRCFGYGWLPEEGVRKRLNELAGY
jgi:WD40 repeat protein